MRTFCMIPAHPEVFNVFRGNGFPGRDLFDHPPRMYGDHRLTLRHDGDRTGTVETAAADEPVQPARPADVQRETAGER